MTENVDVLVSKVTELLDKATGPGMEAAVEAARVAAYSALSGGAVSLVVAVGAVYGVRKLWAVEEDQYDFPIAKIGAVVLCVVAFICGWVAVWSVADPWTWATISHPELWLAKKALGL